ncbi:Tn3 family transposase [Desertifilum sp. FACHB-1129]|uniref:Tn3 family transposase n=1 Tax=unclassified Desertifilum TaxID=2621682 RepID=UPI001684C194|nr:MULTISPECIES: Tn3 family transposase [unclassified Desertifilum]MBD2311078.1 Tn3 family transposase [Desertifilum sp. FACHB-1129]MBD2323945.1 Tn3 family transposase [Desertifilum sp. FACHB-866]MBD2333880.1 Tn3 family transposase [Desertifilum sp. FACHB-868]MDA0211190.1 Tn3 family transposase [Cyanobacteria bacterium FC1]
MKRQWESEELIEHFTLLEGEKTLLANKTGATRLGFAVLLKCFALVARFPVKKQEIPKSVISYIAPQVEVSASQWREYKWSGRTIEYHRAQIRTFFGFREATVADFHSLSEWLSENVLVYDRNEQHLTETVYQRLRELKIEPPTSERIERLIRSALHSYEQNFCATTSHQISPETKAKIDVILNTDKAFEGESTQSQSFDFNHLKADPGRVGLDSLLKEIDKLETIRQLEFPENLFTQISPKVIHHYRQRASAEPPRELRRHPDPIRYTLVAAFCWQRSQEITDSLVELLIQIVHRIGIRAERKVDKELIADFKRVSGKNNILFRMATASLEHPEESVKDVIYPVVSPSTLKNLVKEFKSSGPTYRERVYTVMRASYLHHYRRMVPQILEALEFRSNNELYQPVIKALELIKKYTGSSQHYYSSEDEVLIDGVLKSSWREIVVEVDDSGVEKINRVNYEINGLQALREQLRSKEIWVVGAKRYGNPELDLPKDFEVQRQVYYQALSQPTDAEAFINTLQQKMTEALEKLDSFLPKNQKVKILPRDNGWISVSPLESQPEPLNLQRFKGELISRWPMTSLLDILKETDLRVGFTEQFHSVASRETLDRKILQRRLLLCLFGLGTNTGLKRLSSGGTGENYSDLLYVKRRYLHKENLRNAIIQVVNAIFQVRLPQIWGEGTTACASDSKKFGSWDQNLMTEWHIRYGGRGVMIYWHVEKKSVCIYSQLKTCSSSEVAAMIEGLLRHCTDMKVEKNYVDTHGQSEVAFAFCHLLSFQLLPRLKRIHKQKLYRPAAGLGNAYPNLQPVLTRPINWELIRNQYDQMIKYATALRLGTAETEVILKRFSRSHIIHPTYQALAELGKAVKTIFLCEYLGSEELRQEINEGLNVVEQWNSANSFIFYGKNSEIATNRLADQEIAVLSLHLLQICLVYINTLMMQRILSEKDWLKLMQKDDLRALTPLTWSHINPYGTFRLDLDERLLIDPMAS